MEMSRDVWKSSPNVIAHIEMEAKKHQLDDELRMRKVEQLKVSLFLINLIFSVSKLILIRILLISLWREFSMKWNSTFFFSMRWGECSACHSIWKFSSGKDCSISFPTRKTVYFIKMHGCSDFPNIPVKARKAEHLWRFFFLSEKCPVENPVRFSFPTRKTVFSIQMVSARRYSPWKIYSCCHALLYFKPRRTQQILFCN